ncbi:DUF4157 domain-containing protein [Streptomyces sp. NPDC056580]|uniref:eCIS core domain-containing protein n=1 Tax=Streptomyces sp. NPDC056580 TaxID=3345872 RepID=UPI00369E19EC
MRAHEQPKEADGLGRTKARPAAPAPAGMLALQRSVGNAAVARMVEEERHAHGDCSGAHPERPDGQPAVQRSSVHGVLRSAGRPLTGPVRNEMESRLGADFSDVRLHTGATARASAAEVGARAYTSGSHVVIGEGGADRHTLAHELTHVIQQRKGPVAGTDDGNGLKISDPSDRFEREAEANATRALAKPLAPAQGPEDKESGAAPASAGAVQRMPAKRDRTAAELKGDSPPPQRRNTRASQKPAADLDHPTLTFTSSYTGPASQRLDADQEIGFNQAAVLHNPANAPQRVSSNYHFWQQVTDQNVQIIANDGGHREVPSSRDWVQDGPYRPNYTNAVITDAQDAITFTDDPGFSTSARMSSGYWLKSYSVSFRWKVARNTGRWNTNLPAWTSPEVTHTVTSAFDPDNPEASVPIDARAAGNRSWLVDLTNVS